MTPIEKTIFMQGQDVYWRGEQYRVTRTFNDGTGDIVKNVDLDQVNFADKGCEYCGGAKSLDNSPYTNHVWHDSWLENGYLQFNQYVGEREYQNRVPIEFCPKCGRRLSQNE